MYLCIAPLSRFYYPETRRFINAFNIIIIIIIIFFIYNLVPKRKTPTYRASPTQEPGPSVVVKAYIYVVNNLMDMQTKTSLFFSIHFF